MGILNYNMSPDGYVRSFSPNEYEERLKRNPAKDLKEGIDLVFDLKAKIDKFHPISSETLIRMLCM